MDRDPRPLPAATAAPPSAGAVAVAPTGSVATPPGPGPAIAGRHRGRSTGGPLTPVALRLTAPASTARWPVSVPTDPGPAVAGATPVAAAAPVDAPPTTTAPAVPVLPALDAPAPDGSAPPARSDERSARILRRLRGDAAAGALAPHRPEAHRYATHVLGLPDDEAAAALVDRALDRALRSYRGWRRLRRRPTGLGARIREAIRVEAWRRQRRAPRAHH